MSSLEQDPSGLRIAVLGAGAWGTALSNVLARAGHTVSLWGHDPAHLADIRRSRVNARYLPCAALEPAVQPQEDLERACLSVDGVLVAVPSRGVRELGERLSAMGGVRVPLLSVTKGIEFRTGLTMSGVMRGLGLGSSVAALSGPTLAEEVARLMPSAVVVGGEDAESCRFWQAALHRPEFRVYTSPDIRGVELGGALKNVIAIAAGVSDGLGFGDNSKAALVTRAIVEVRRLGVACGAMAETFSGLSGLGDLTVTCFSKLSRNRAFGERLARGATVTQIVESATSIAEGYPTARSAWRLARQHEVTTPIVDQVYSMLYEGKNVRQALKDLIARDSKQEAEAIGSTH